MTINIKFTNKLKYCIIDNEFHCFLGIIVMLHHTLICQLNESKIKFRTTCVSSKPDIHQLYEICLHNVNTIQKILDYCFENDITSYRIPSNIFPLWTHPLYEDMSQQVFNSLIPNLKGLVTHDIHLSCHPDQFILLNSLNQDVNERSIKELNKWGEISKIIPLKLLNIHVGGRQGTLHISSPKNGWTANFKDNCMHADYINFDTDYPHELVEFSKKRDICLDVEAKAKNHAIHALYMEWF